MVEDGRPELLAGEPGFPWDPTLGVESWPVEAGREFAFAFGFAAGLPALFPALPPAPGAPEEPALPLFPGLSGRPGAAGLCWSDEAPFPGLSTGGAACAEEAIAPIARKPDVKMAIMRRDGVSTHEVSVMTGLSSARRVRRELSPLP